MTHAPGTPVRVEMTKWGGTPHWEYAAVHLGTDVHGEWLGLPAGTAYSRPGRRLTIPYDHVTLVPGGPDGSDRPWHLAVFYSGEGPAWPGLDSPVEVYVDITTPAVWDGTTLRAVDLDLDVVRGTSGRTVVADEDEFAEHRVRHGYPAEVIAAARASCRAVLAAVQAGVAPYDGTHRTRVAALRARRTTSRDGSPDR